MSDTAHTRAARRNHKPISPTNTGPFTAPAGGQSHDALSPFHWHENCRPSIFYTEAGEKAAKRLVGGSNGKAIDQNGRQIVDIKPHKGQSIVITRQDQADRTQAIKRGTSR